MEADYLVVEDIRLFDERRGSTCIFNEIALSI